MKAAIKSIQKTQMAWKFGLLRKNFINYIAIELISKLLTFLEKYVQIRLKKQGQDHSGDQTANRLHRLLFCWICDCPLYSDLVKAVPYWPLLLDLNLFMASLHSASQCTRPIPQRTPPINRFRMSPTVWLKSEKGTSVPDLEGHGDVKGRGTTLPVFMRSARPNIRVSPNAVPCFRISRRNKIFTIIIFLETTSASNFKIFHDVAMDSRYTSTGRHKSTGSLS